MAAVITVTLRIVLHRLHDACADDVGVGLRAARLQRTNGRALGADLLEHRRRVVRHRVLGCLRDAVPLFGEDVQQHRPF